jgi:hypothetical protein
MDRGEVMLPALVDSDVWGIKSLLFWQWMGGWVGYMAGDEAWQLQAADGSVNNWQSQKVPLGHDMIVIAQPTKQEDENENMF